MGYIYITCTSPIILNSPIKDYFSSNEYTVSIQTRMAQCENNIFCI